MIFTFSLITILAIGAYVALRNDEVHRAHARHKTTRRLKADGGVAPTFTEIGTSRLYEER